ncbi:MAG: DUF6476 family protein [Microgenomates group bacterium]
MTDSPSEPDLPPSLRFLKALVIVLMITMIAGVITVVGLLVTRMPDANAIAPVLPDQIQLPPGQTAAAVTMGKGWIAVVTEQQSILIFNPDGSLRQTVAIN